MNYSGTWAGTIFGTPPLEFNDLKLVHRGPNLSGTISVSLNPSDPSHPLRPAQVSGSVEPDGRFMGEIFLKGPPRKLAFSVKGRFISATVAEGNVDNKLTNTTGKLSMERTGD